MYEVSHTLTHNIGLQIPNQFNLFNIPIGALGLTLAGGQSIQDLINQLIAGGGINQANTTGIAALLAQLTGGNTNSIFSQPLATFGGGKTLMGVSLGTLGATLSRSESQLRSLQHVTVRAAQGKDATMNLGSRYPIINASFAPIFNTAAISQVIANNSFIAPVPSFTYEDTEYSREPHVKVDDHVDPVIAPRDLCRSHHLELVDLVAVDREAPVGPLDVVGQRATEGTGAVQGIDVVVAAHHLAPIDLRIEREKGPFIEVARHGGGIELPPGVRVDEGSGEMKEPKRGAECQDQQKGGSVAAH